MANPPEVERALEFGMNALAQDQRTIAERKWQARTKAPKPQKPCDIGLFSDEAGQSDLVSLLIEAERRDDEYQAMHGSRP